jgi:hypothetical protein
MTIGCGDTHRSRAPFQDLPIPAYFISSCWSRPFCSPVRAEFTDLALATLLSIENVSASMTPPDNINKRAFTPDLAVVCSHHSNPTPSASRRTTLAATRPILPATDTEGAGSKYRSECKRSGTLVSRYAPVELTLSTRPVPIVPSLANKCTTRLVGCRRPQRCSIPIDCVNGLRNGGRR